MHSTPDNPKRCWWRLSMRTFLVLLTIGCLGLGWFVSRVTKQRRAVQWVEESGGRVIYDYEMRRYQWPFVEDAKPPPGPAWLRDLIGIDYFAKVVTVDLYDSQVRDLATLANLKDLSLLYVDDKKVSKVHRDALQKSLPSLIILVPFVEEFHYSNGRLSANPFTFSELEVLNCIYGVLDAVKKLESAETEKAVEAVTSEMRSYFDVIIPAAIESHLGGHERNRYSKLLEKSKKSLATMSQTRTLSWSITFEASY